MTYSYQSLLEAFNVLSDNMQELGIRSVAIEEKLNTVVVTPFDNDPTLQTKMDSLVDSNVVTIQYPAVSNTFYYIWAILSMHYAKLRVTAN